MLGPTLPGCAPCQRRIVAHRGLISAPGVWATCSAAESASTFSDASTKVVKVNWGFRPGIPAPTA